MRQRRAANVKNSKRNRQRRAQAWRIAEWALASFAGLLLLADGPRVLAQSKGASEYQVKAAFLYHFAQFVEWPPGAFREAGAPLTYCLLGDDSFGGAFELALGGKSVGTHPVRVRHLGQVKDVSGCHVLFVSASEKKNIAAVLEGAKGNPVLTVGDSEHFVEEGGMIGLFLEDNKVRFEINAGAAQQAGLKISARLLALASKVIGGPKGS